MASFRLCFPVCPQWSGASPYLTVVSELTDSTCWGVFVPNIKSAKKDLRKSRAAAVRNRAQRSALRTAVKRAKLAAAGADDRLSAVSLLDRAARKGLIHPNAAARQKSKMAKAANKAA